MGAAIMISKMLQLSGAVADLMYQVEQVPVAGEEAVVRGFSIAPGGGFNAMVAAKRAGIAVHYGGALGTGPFADIVAKGLADEGIELVRTRDPERDQGCCSVLIDQTGERTFIASDGAEGHATFPDLAQLDLGDYDWTLLSGYALHYAGSRDVLKTWLSTIGQAPNLVFDPSPMIASIPEHVLEPALNRATWISANAREAAVLTGLNDPELAAKSLAANRPTGGGAVVRNGALGCIVATAQNCTVLPAFQVEIVDTNGAGDTHIGSFLARLSQGDTPIEAAQYANVAAALSITQIGPASAPERDLVMKATQQKQAG